MGVFGPYESASALLESFSSPFQHGVEDTFKQPDWKVFDTIEIGNADNWKQLVSNKNFSSVVVPGFFATKVSDPEVYVHLMPSSEMPSDYAALFKWAHDRRGTADLAATSMKKGFPVSKMRVYLVGPDRSVFEKLVAEGQKHYEKGDRAAVARALMSKGRAWYQSNKQVLGWIDLTRTTIRTPEGHPSLQFKVTGKAIHHLGGTPEVIRYIDDPDYTKLISPVTRHNTQEQLVDRLMQYYVTTAWGYASQPGFYVFATQSHEGPQKTVEHAMADHRDEHDVLKNIKRAKPPVRPNRPATGSLVVGSIRAEGGEMRHETVTADERMRVWMLSDGSFTKPAESVDQRSLFDMPAAKNVKAIVEVPGYKAVFGLYIDHPIIRPGLRDSTWWYQSKSLYHGALKHYGEVTGDRPHLAYYMVQTSGPKAGMMISKRELDRRTDDQAQAFKRAVETTIKDAYNANAEGQRMFPVHMLQKFNYDVKKAGMFETPSNPLADSPEGIDEEDWNNYVNWLRKGFKKPMGFNLSAAEGAKYLNSKGERLPLVWSRGEINKRRAKRRTQAFSGGKKEPWALFLIQYVLAHGASETNASPTFMIPLNIIRSKRVKIKPMKLTSVRESHLKKWLRDNHSDFKFFEQVHAWSFIRAHPNLPFPYARLIRPSISTDPKARERYNRMLPKGIQVTQRGYRINGVSYDAYMMVVAMPPSAAEKEFGLLSKNKTARKIITDNEMLNRLRRTPRGKRRSMQELDLFAAPTPFVGAGASHPDDDADVEFKFVSRAGNNYYIRDKKTGKAVFAPPGKFVQRPDYDKKIITSIRNRARLGDTDPVSAGVVDHHTPYATPEMEYMDLGEKFSPVIKSHFDRAGNVIKRIFSAYEHSGSAEQREAAWDQYIREAMELETTTETQINNMMQHLLAVQLRRRPERGTKEYDMMNNVRQYVRFVKKEIGSSGRTVRVPEVVKQMKLSEYHAPVGSSGHRTGVLAVKAPSEDIAKLVIFYRLLRRSVNNKAVGRLMKVTDLGGRRKLFPEEHARLLAQWASMHFGVIQNESAGTWTQYKPQEYSNTDWESIRNRQYGDSGKYQQGKKHKKDYRSRSTVPGGIGAHMAAKMMRVD
jgi:hypothetical protein